MIKERNYCIELIPQGNRGHAVVILKNNEIVDETPAFSNFVDSHLTCFDSFDLENDIFELRNGGIDAVTIAINLINRGVSKTLKFGRNANVTKVAIDENSLYCQDDAESVFNIRIRNENVLESELLRYNIVDLKNTFQFILDIK